MEQHFENGQPQVYVCRRCGGKVTRRIVREEAGRAELWWMCQESAHLFGFPWLENQWAEPTSDPSPVPDLEPWLESETRPAAVSMA